MYLKELTINGFKSFAKKDELEFSAPITAIVGPNGSGKSNVAESFRFVLGGPCQLHGCAPCPQLGSWASRLGVIICAMSISGKNQHHVKRGLTVLVQRETERERANAKHVR